MAFKKGNQLGSTTQGAKAFIAELRRKFEEGENKELIMAALDKEIKKDPLKAYKEYYFPTLPKQLELGNEENGSPFKVTVVTKSDN